MQKNSSTLVFGMPTADEVVSQKATELRYSRPSLRKEELDFDEDLELPTEPMTINMGPSHPATHGTVRIVLTVEGETVLHSDVEVGYLHRCFEKEAENATWTQVFPYTDRLNYVSPLLNNVGYALAVEKLIGIDKLIPQCFIFFRYGTAGLFPFLHQLFKNLRSLFPVFRISKCFCFFHQLHF